MDRKTIIARITVLALLWLRGLAQAQSPHFISASDSLMSQDEPGAADLRASWKEAAALNARVAGATYVVSGIDKQVRRRPEVKPLELPKLACSSHA